MKNVIAYHWMPGTAWDSIVRGHRYRGLDPKSGRALIDFHLLSLKKLFPQWAFQHFIFCLINEPEPESWTVNPEFPGLWNLLMSKLLGDSKVICLLKFKVRPSDKAWVVDWAHMGKRAYYRKPNEKMSNVEGIAKYIQSRTPLSKYKEGSYAVPELLIGNKIPFERLELVKIWNSKEYYNYIVKRGWGRRK